MERYMERFDEREIKAVEAVIRSGKLSQFFKNFEGGKHVRAFERMFAKYIGSRYAISVSNGTVSLEIALKALGISKGDEVITTPLSFIATGTAILSVGATPVFADIDPETLNIDPDEIRKAITDKTRVILPVSLLGYPADMEKIWDIAMTYGLYVVEDGAQALGASINGKKIGTWGNLGSFSFQETKQISSLGEGGMLVTDDNVLAKFCKAIRNHGNLYGDFHPYTVCTNSRMTEAQAAFGKVQLTKLDAFNKVQIQNAEYFLSNLPKGLQPICEDGLDGSIYLLIPTILSPNLNRDKFIQKLTDKGISKGVPGQNVGYYESLTYDAPIFSPYRKECPNAEWARDNVILFDIHRWGATVNTLEKALKIIEEALT